MFIKNDFVEIQYLNDSIKAKKRYYQISLSILPFRSFFKSFRITLDVLVFQNMITLENTI